MSIIKKIIYVFKLPFNKKIRFSYLEHIGMYSAMSDKEYLKKKFKIFMDADLDLDKPKTFNQKLQWLKLNNRKPVYTTLVDKVEVKRYISEFLGEKYVIPTLGIWESIDEIDFDYLPRQFVLKCNHNSGTGMCICRDKSKLNIQRVKKDLKKGLKENYYLYGREWPYKDIRPKIIAEKFMVQDEDNFEKALIDYKFFCFNGVVDSVMVCTERETGIPKFYFFDKNWNLKRYNICGKEAPDDFTLPKPDCIHEMFRIAEKLSMGIPYVRVDLYCISGHVYFGEMTFYPDSGFDSNLLKETDYYWGQKLQLPLKN